MGWDVVSLSKSITEADEDAKTKCASLADKDVTVLMGCTGSGKTTVSLYVQGRDFELTRGELRASDAAARAEIGNTSQSATWGLKVAEKEIGSTQLVDLAGTGDSAGPEADVCGGVHRSAVIQAAGSVRVVLVMSLDRVSIGNNRAQGVVRDLEHVAGFFRGDVKRNVGAVGLIVTCSPLVLLEASPAAGVLYKMSSTLEDLVSGATRHEGAGMRQAGIAMTAAGLELLQHFSEQCTQACSLIDEVKEGDDLELVARLVSARCAVFPVNVLQESQRSHLESFIANLRPVERPRATMSYVLPDECRSSLSSTLDKERSAICERLDSKGVDWASDQGLRERLFNLLHLFGVMGERGLLEWAQTVERELVRQLVSQNNRCVADLVDGVALGNVSKVDGALAALHAMDSFRKDLAAKQPSLKLQDWSSCRTATNKAMETMKKEERKLLPEDLSSMNWGSSLSVKLLAMLKVAAKLDSQGRDFVQGWAKRLACHIAALKSQAAECTEVSSVILALRHLKEQCQFLPEILEFLATCGGELPTSLEPLLLETKGAVREKLQEMSRKMLDALKGPGRHVGIQERERLRPFCDSSELNDLLGGENLAEVLILKPLSSVLVPNQKEINSLVALLGQEDPSDVWCTDLSHFAQRIESAGDLGMKMIELAGLDLRELLEALTEKVEQEKATVQKTAREFADTLQQPRPSLASASILSGGPELWEAECEFLEEPVDVEATERAVARLKFLLPGDTLLELLAEAPDPSRTALRALDRCASALRSTARSLLKKAGKELRRSGGVLDFRAMSVMVKLAVCCPLSKVVLEALCNSSDSFVANTRSTLEGITEEATTFLRDYIQGQLKQWEEATAGTKGWQQLFLRHLHQARRLEVLSEEDVCPAKTLLLRKILEWRENCLAKAQEARERAEAWPDFLDLAVRQGLAFEESALFTVTGLQEEDFRELVETQVLRWTREAETSPSSITPAMAQKLRAAAAALEQLPGYARKDTRTLQLRSGLSKPLERLEAALTESEARFQRALAEERYPEACQCLNSAQESCPQQELLMEELGRAVEEKLEQLGSNADEVDMVQAAKKLRSLLQTLERAKPRGAEMAERVRTFRVSLGEGLKAQTQEATEQLQRALDGRGMPSRALTVLAALSGMPKMTVAEEGLQNFISKKKEDIRSMGIQQLLDWITRQDGLQRSAGVPEELKGRTSQAYEELIKKDFIPHFSDAFRAGLDDLEKRHGEKDWGQVKQTAEMLRDVIESALELEVLRKEGQRLRGLRSRLGVGSGGCLAQAKEDMRRGSFWMALRKLVAGEGGSAEQELCEAISAEVARNMNTANQDVATHSQRLSVLESFLAEVGEHPPEELKSLAREAQEVCRRLRPRVETAALAAVEESLAAASGREIELQRTVKALALVKKFEGLVSGEKMEELREAVANFWARVRRAVDKVVEDIRGLEVQSLTLSLEPLRHWLHAFSQLSGDEKEILMGGLHSQLTDLKEWLRETLSKPLEDLVDASSVAGEADNMSFASISLRCRVAEKLSGLLQTATVDLRRLEDKMSWHKDGGMAALQRSAGLEDFNPHYKALKSASVELPELVVASRYVGELRDAFRVSVLDPHLLKLKEARNVDDALKPIMDLRTLANEAPDAHEDVTIRLRSGLSELQGRFKSREINALGGRLGQCQLGHLVLAEFPEVFGSAKEMQSNAAFRRAGEMGNSEELVARLTRESGLSPEEWGELASCLRLHELKFEELKRHYLLRGKSLDVVKEEAKQDLETLVNKVMQQKGAHRRAEAGREVITHLTICYSIVKCGREFMEASAAEQQERFIAPHRGQILTIFRLLHAHKTGPVSVWCWLWPWTSTTASVANTAASRVPENHLAQVLTGEGKALILGLLAAFLALQGVSSDVVCYRKILTAQDWQAMHPFYAFLGVEEKIRYLTFDELCEERLQAIRNSSEQLLKGAASISAGGLRDVSRRALLIDEVDVFFGRRFYGQTWDGAFKLRTPAAVALVRYVFEEARSGRQVNDVRQTAAFTALLAETPKEMHVALACTAMALVENIEDWAKPEPVLDEVSGQLGYKENDDINYDLSYANKTVFAYLTFEMDGRLTSEQVAPHVGIDLVCGRFSFAELPKEYCCILGVTGTLKGMLEVEGIEHLLKKEYGFKHFTFTPSVFGEQRLTFKAAEHIEILDNESDWISRIESVVEDQKQSGNATLVFFKNEAQLHKFPNWKTFESLTERTEPRRRSGYVAAANAPGRVTLLTKAFGRGIDFQMPDGHQVVVLQTFLSSMVSEETQIKGRTARQGKPGQYRMILCSEHLQAKMAFTPQDIQNLKSASGNYIQRLLCNKQHNKTQSKVQGLRQRKNKAAQLEKDTKVWEDLLFDAAAPKSQKLQKLAAWNADVRGFLHYTVLLDNSHSMLGESRWQALTTAFDSFRQELLSDKGFAAAITVSVCLFNNMAQVVRPTHSKPAEVQSIGCFQVGGGTSFSAAFKAAHYLMGHSPPSTKESILFLTDGEARIPQEAVAGLIADHGHRIKDITCVAFGREAGVSTLKQIGVLFEAAGISFRLMTPCDQQSLVQNLIEAASNRAVHLGSASP